MTDVVDDDDIPAGGGGPWRRVVAGLADGRMTVWGHRVFDASGDKVWVLERVVQAAAAAGAAGAAGVNSRGASAAGACMRLQRLQLSPFQLTLSRVPLETYHLNPPLVDTLKTPSQGI